MGRRRKCKCGCGRSLPAIALQHEDEFATTDCCRKYHKLVWSPVALHFLDDPRSGNYDRLELKTLISERRKEQLKKLPRELR